jgi:hypothetical protein
MGNAMACCGKNDPDPNNINTAGFGGDTKGGHLKIAQIIKI